MAFPTSFPVDPGRVQLEAEKKAQQAAAKKYWSFLDTLGKEVTVQEIKADDLIQRAQELGEVIWHRSKGNIGHIDLDTVLANRSLAKVEAAIKAAKQAKYASDKNKATKFLRKATMSFSIANRMLSKSMTRGARGGTLRRKHRKSVKRCKS
jgi:hypothetical protein